MDGSCTQPRHLQLWQIFYVVSQSSNTDPYLTERAFLSTGQSCSPRSIILFFNLSSCTLVVHVDMVWGGVCTQHAVIKSSLPCLTSPPPPTFSSLWSSQLSSQLHPFLPKRPCLRKSLGAFLCPLMSLETVPSGATHLGADGNFSVL